MSFSNTKKVFLLLTVFMLFSSCSNDSQNETEHTVTIKTAYPHIPENLDDTSAIRFLNKTTFGATQESISELQSKGVVNWIDEQLKLPAQERPYLIKMIEIAKAMNPEENPKTVEEYLADNDISFNKDAASFHSPRYRMSAWFDIALSAKDQLRQKVTYALSQIIVESDFESTFTRRAEALATYYDILHKNAFGQYSDLLNDISLNSGMGMFLTYNGSKAQYLNESNITVYPDENYAREVMQLFSIGLSKLNLDGSNILDEKQNATPSYTQNDVNELARVFTGWDLKNNPRYGLTGSTRGDLTQNLEFTAEYHDSGEKSVLGKTIPAGLTGEEDIKHAIDIIMSQSSVAPYISRHLIMRLVKSNPSPSYIQRIATVFQDTSGDLKAVTRAIFLDSELWDDIANKKTVKFKEPLIAYTSFLRSFHVKPLPSWYSCNNGNPSDDTASNCNLVTDSYLFNDTRGFLNQGPALAPNVFNFYDNGFIPNDTNFKSSSTVAPEAQIQSDSYFISFSNTIIDILYKWDKNYLTNEYFSDRKNDEAKKRYDTVEEYITDAPIRNYNTIYNKSSDKMLLDTKDELAAMEKVIDGDTNGDFLNLQDYREEYIDDEKAVDTLVEHLNQKLTGGLLSTEQESVIANNLKAKIFNKYSVGFPETENTNESQYNKKRQLLKNVIFPAIRAVVTSNVYMTE